ncbi:MAG TPA: pyruvate kinase [Gammaproteobacteria bacterium]|nr:pyruvate kinase [Gammaproteobacteria bacterium]
MPKRTKIVATLGPATDPPGVLGAVIAAGADVLRLNFSHGCPGEHRARARRVRQEAAALGRNVAILGDLQGPKIRIQRFAAGAALLQEGGDFVLDAALGPDEGDSECVGISYKELPNDVHPGDTLLVDDGRIVLAVDRVEAPEIRTRVLVGGELSNNKGINRQGGGLSAPAITEKDCEDIRLAADLGVDYLAVSFVRGPDDLLKARTLLKKAGGEAGIIAKIERAEAVTAVDDLMAISDAIMIARGDLGVEIDDAELPAVQKALINKARSMNRVAITATQMMQSMIANPIPTRAEVFDVANAVLDGTDAVMLSAETATGKYPVQAVKAMAHICEVAERQRSALTSDYRVNTRFVRVDEAIAMSTMYAANHLGVRAIAAMTESGSTPLWMSRISSGIPIYALTRHDRTCRRVALYRGVYPVKFTTSVTEHVQANREAEKVLIEAGVVQKGDLVIITKGDLMGREHGTNSMRIANVGVFDERRSEPT